MCIVRNFNVIAKVCIFLCFHLQVVSQSCIDDFFTMSYKGSGDFTISRSIITSKNEIVCAGKIGYTRAGYICADGWIAKLNLKGTVLWSKRFKVPGYDYAVLNDIVQGLDDSYYAVGDATDTVGGVISDNVKGLLVHIDKYGSVVRSGGLQISGSREDETFFKSILKTSDGDFIIGGYNNIGVFYSGQTNLKGALIRMDKAGTIKWITTYSSSKFNLRFLFPNTVLETTDGQVITAIGTQQFSSTNMIIENGFHFISVNKNTGSKNWDNVCVYSGLQNSVLVSLSSVSHIAEMPGGNISFNTSFSDSAIYNQPGYNGKSVNIITNNSGTFKKAVSYYNNRPGSSTAAGIKLNDNGDQLFFMDDGESNVLVKTDKDGKAGWQKGFGNSAGNPLPASLNHLSDNTNYLLMNDRKDNNIIHLYKTDTTASIDCIQADVGVVTEDATPYFRQSNSEMIVVPSGVADFVMPSLPLVTGDFIITASITCRKPCCVDVINTIDTLSLCDASSYRLPNNDVVTVSNTYYISYKTSKGCDSIVYYPVVFKKKPAISLGPDDCLEGKDTIQLKADAGFAAYNWMNNFTDNPFFTIKTPGTYWVSITNECGTSTDSITIFKNCEADIYIPSAFTPNGDNVNDYFRIPNQNTNKLIQLEIYNRFGNLVFKTRDINAGWNGTIKNIPQATGTYVYSIKMETLSGKKISKKGTFILIR